MKLVTITWLSPLLSKKLDGNTLRHTWDTVIVLKTALKQAILSILRIFQLLKNLKNKFCCKPLRICVKLVTITVLSPLLSKKFHGNTLRHAWDTVILLKTAYFKHFEHFPAVENLKNNFCCKPLWYVWNWVTITWLSALLSKNCMVIPWGMPKIQCFLLKQPILSILNIFQQLKN